MKDRRRYRLKMIRLFDEIPYLKGDKIILRPMADTDIPALKSMVSDDEVYRFLPTFLYERKYEDKKTMLERMEEECVKTKESILLAICPEDDPARFMGIAEIYNYEPEKEKASVGYRLRREYWGRGAATEVTAILKRYLLEKTDVRKITAHVMIENRASGRVLEKNGFIPKWRNLTEDWGMEQPVVVDKYRFKMSPEDKASLLQGLLTDIPRQSL